MKPRLFREYERWAEDSISLEHRLSELELDRGFTEEAARSFIRAFDETVSFAKLHEDDSLSSNPAEGQEDDMPEPTLASPQPKMFQPIPSMPFLGGGFGPVPFSQRCTVEMTPGSVKVAATLLNAAEVDKLIRVLEANKALLDEDDKPAVHDEL